MGRTGGVFDPSKWCVLIIRCCFCTAGLVAQRIVSFLTSSIVQRVFSCSTDSGRPLHVITWRSSTAWWRLRNRPVTVSHSKVAFSYRRLGSSLWKFENSYCCAMPRRSLVPVPQCGQTGQTDPIRNATQRRTTAVARRTSGWFLGVHAARYMARGTKTTQLLWWYALVFSGVGVIELGSGYSSLLSSSQFFLLLHRWFVDPEEIVPTGMI